MTNAEVLHQVEHGYRMASPQGCPAALYDIMLECWHKVSRLNIFSLKINIINVLSFSGSHEETYI